MPWDGADYQARFDALAASGADVHGEAAFVLALGPTSVLDAGCGTGRVAIQLAAGGLDVVGADVDPSMLATAAERAPGLTWVQADLAAGFDLGRTFDVVVMAGNVVHFTPRGTEAALVDGCARHVAPDGLLVAGFEVGARRPYGIDDYDADCAAAGLRFVDRFATWDRQPWPGDGTWAVSVHRPDRFAEDITGSITP